MTAFTDLLERVRLLIFRKREEHDLAEELSFHVEMEAEQSRGLGLDPVEARRRSRIALGGVEQIKEEVRDARGTRLFEDSVGDVGHAIRGLLRSPGFAAVSILTLAIGIGGTTAVFSAVDAVLLQPLPYEEPGQLVRLYQYDEKYPEDGFVTPVHYLAYRTQLSSLESAAAIYTYNATGADIGGSQRPERIQVLQVSSDYFRVVRVPPIAGRGFQIDEETGAPVVVLSHALWQRIFHGDPAAIGRTLTMSGTPYTVAGVMPNGFSDPVAGRVDAWIPIDLREGYDPSQAGNHYITVVGRLKRGTTVAQAQAEIEGLDKSLAQRFPNFREARGRFHPLKDDIVAPASLSLKIMMGAVGLVLLLVCVNIANLLLVRGANRAKELALRGALGASRARLIRQLLIESITLALAGDIAGIILARLIMSAIVALGAGSIPRLSSLTLQPRLLVFSVIVASLSAVVFGLAPAIRSTRTEGDATRDQNRTHTDGAAQGRLRSALVVSQVALAFVLLVGAGLLLASFRRLREVDLGVATDPVLTYEVQLPAARYDSTARARLYEELAVQTERIPGVVSAGGISRLPATGQFHQWSAVALTGPLVGTKEASASPGPQQRVVSGDYFRALGMTVVAGRTFDRRDVAGAPDAVVISKNLAERLFPHVDPIGQRVRAGGRNNVVIGVVSDVAVDAEGSIPTYVYHAHAQFAGDRNWQLSQVVSTGGRPEDLEPAIRSVLAGLDPELVMYSTAPLSEAIGQGTAGRVFMLRILTSFAGVALALAALGLFGVLSYAVKLRSKEFGIRMALGADRGAVRAMVLRHGLTVTALGIGIGLAASVALSRVMATVVFRVSPLDPLVLTGAVAFMTLVATLAAYLPAYRATAVDPKVVLQGE